MNLILMLTFKVHYILIHCNLKCETDWSVCVCRHSCAEMRVQVHKKSILRMNIVSFLEVMLMKILFLNLAFTIS